MSSAAARTDVTDVDINCRRPAAIVTTTPADTTASIRPNPLSDRRAVNTLQAVTCPEAATTTPGSVSADEGAAAAPSRRNCNAGHQRGWQDQQHPSPHGGDARYQTPRRRRRGDSGQSPVARYYTRCETRWRGSTTSIRAPPDEARAAVTRPLWVTMIFCVSAKPRPVPPLFVVKNGRNILSP